MAAARSSTTASLTWPSAAFWANSSRRIFLRSPPPRNRPPARITTTSATATQKGALRISFGNRVFTPLVCPLGGTSVPRGCRRCQEMWRSGLRTGPHADVGEVAVPLVDVEPVADDEGRRDAEADVLEGRRALLATLADEQSAHLQAGRVAGLEVLAQVGQGQTAVDD